MVPKSSECAGLKCSCDVKSFGISYASAEHAFQYSKAMRYGDLVRASSVRNAATALEAKRIGAQVTVPDHWIQQRENIMRKVLEAKFDQVVEFRDKISATGSSTLLVEAAFDDYWGSGLDKKGTIYTEMKGVARQKHHGPNTYRYWSITTSECNAEETVIANVIISYV